MIAAFIVLNVLIGVVLHSMEEAREIERRERTEAARGSGAVGRVQGDAALDPLAGLSLGTLPARIATLPTALDELEAELGRTGAEDAEGEPGRGADGGRRATEATESAREASR